MCRWSSHLQDRNTAPMLDTLRCFEWGRRSWSGKTHLVSPFLQQIMAAAPSSPLTTHVLNTEDGVPAAKMAISLHQLDSKLIIWNMLSVGTTTKMAAAQDSSAKKLLPLDVQAALETGSYWQDRGQTSFYPYVEIVFTISDPEQKFHIPLLMSRFSYSTYRGS
ncbi:hypothetical protein INR49_003875 [Caranx melampygus]|nr:hypothetical protein INR49_003875 [Caranx melampygus]